MLGVCVMLDIAALLVIYRSVPLVQIPSMVMAMKLVEIARAEASATTALARALASLDSSGQDVNTKLLYIKSYIAVVLLHIIRKHLLS